MAKIYKYRKVIDEFTTHCLVEPDYNLLDTTDRITELCTIDGETWVSIPDSIMLPEQPEIITHTLEKVTLTEELLLKIKAVSPHIRLINNRIVERIRSSYSIDDEIKMIRLAPSAESAAYNDFVEECRAWGRAEKKKLGL